MKQNDKVEVWKTGNKLNKQNIPNAQPCAPPTGYTQCPAPPPLPNKSPPISSPALPLKGIRSVQARFPTTPQGIPSTQPRPTLSPQNMPAARGTSPLEFCLYCSLFPYSFHPFFPDFSCALSIGVAL